MPVERGQMRRQEVLGSTATYRVVAVDAGHVTVEVLDAPGLRAGDRFRFTLAQVEAMDLADDEPTAPA